LRVFLFSGSEVHLRRAEVKKKSAKADFGCRVKEGD
jgi:hypothetical protein